MLQEWKVNKHQNQGGRIIGPGWQDDGQGRGRREEQGWDCIPGPLLKIRGCA